MDATDSHCYSTPKGLKLAVSADGSDSSNSSSLSPLSLSERSDTLSPDFSRNPPELTRNSLGRKPARHRKGPAPPPPFGMTIKDEELSKYYADSGEDKHLTTSFDCSSSGDTNGLPLMNRTESSILSRNELPHNTCSTSITLHCNVNEEEETTAKINLTKPAVVTHTIQLSAPSSTEDTVYNTQLIRRDAFQKFSGVLPYRITVPSPEQDRQTIKTGQMLQGRHLILINWMDTV